jgi:nitrogen fixation/metabolism regulation signal transduction histidine kinase
MQKITKLVSQGFLNERVVVKSNDELSELAASLNQMIDSLEKNTKEIRTDTLQEEKEFAKAKNDLSEEKDRRQQAEKKQHQSENTFWALANNIGIGIALINQDMEVTGINTLMKKWFPDVNVEETPHCYQAFHNPPMQILCADCPVHSAFLDGKSHQRLTQMEIGNRKRDMQIISCPIFDEDGNIVNVIEMFGDITKKS